MKIGILGAGQLGRMLALAGTPLGFEFIFIDPAADACAASLGEHLQADYADPAALARFCAHARLVTYEFENVPISIAERISANLPLYPGVAALRASQDRLSEKQMFTQLGIDVPLYQRVDSLAGLSAAAAHTGLPAVLKTRRMGYDGKGQIVLRSEDELGQAWSKLGGQPLILEAFVNYTREISCLAVRARDGSIRFYPVVENQHQDGILRVSRPRTGDPMQAQAQDYSTRVLEKLDYVGLMAFEFFDLGDRLLANEIAPRVHNSGHWSIEGSVCSQFENHLRAVAGLPLGETRLREPSAMINLIGSMPALSQLAALPHTHVHDYGKTAKPLRKLGHVTVLGEDDEALDARIKAVQATFGGRN